MMSERNDATICAESKTDDSRSENTEATQLNEAQKEFLRAINAEDFKCAEKALRPLNKDEVIDALYVWKPVHTSLPVQFFVMGLRAAITEIKRAEPEAKPVSDADFFEACRTGKEITVQQFIAQGGNIEMRDGNGRTGLIIAAWYEKWDVLRSLAAHGADLNVVDKDGFSALSIALCALNNNIGCANELMRHGAKLELPPEEKEDSNA